MTRTGEEDAVLKRNCLIICLIAAFLLGGCTPEVEETPLPSTEVSDAMRELYQLRLEYCQEKYGDEFILDDYLGAVYSTRFPGVEIQLYYDSDTRTFRDKYLVYLREAELLEILRPIVQPVYEGGQSFVSPYGYCSGEATTETTAEELLGMNEWDQPAVQLTIYTDKDPMEREEDFEILADAIQAKQYSLYVNIIYVPTENLALAEEAEQSTNLRRSRDFFLWIGDALVTPDGVNEVFTSIWNRGNYWNQPSYQPPE